MERDRYSRQLRALHARHRYDEEPGCPICRDEVREHMRRLGIEFPDEQPTWTWSPYS